MKTLAALSLIVIAGVANAGELYSNGPVANALGRSVVKSPATSYGFGDQASALNAVADDFTVSGPGWTVSDIDFFGYQTSATSFGFQDVTWSIVSGDLNANHVVASGVTSVTDGGLVGYRVASNDRRNKDRAIYDIKADIPDVTLGAGTYWLTWSLTGNSAFSGPWQPPTSNGASGNAQQSVGGGAFSALIDAGSGSTVTLPFILNGTVSAVPEPATVLSFAAGLALLATRRRRQK